MSTCFKKTHGIYKKEHFQAVLRAAGETETTQENIQDWLELDEEYPGFQLLTEDETVAVVFFLPIFSSALPMLLNFPFICFFFCLSVLSFASLIWIIG
jgi:hypothetical protein